MRSWTRVPRSKAKDGCRLRLLDHPLQEGRLGDDAHGALPEFLDGLGNH
jgi:hypothetical protein